MKMYKNNVILYEKHIERRLIMNWGRFVAGVVTGVVASYLITQKKPATFIKPEKIIQMVRNRYKSKMSIVGSWIHTEPKAGELNGIQYNLYEGGFTGVVNGSPRFYEFVVDAETGTLLKVEE
jgi:predicted small secreted protein